MADDNKPADPVVGGDAPTVTPDPVVVPDPASVIEEKTPDATPKPDVGGGEGVIPDATPKPDVGGDAEKKPEESGGVPPVV